MIENKNMRTEKINLKHQEQYMSKQFRTELHSGLHLGIILSS